MAGLYGWEMYDSAGRLVADNSSIMSRRLFTYSVPLIRALSANIPWEVSFNVNFSNGTPYAHCNTRTGVVVPASTNWYPVSPDIIISGNAVTLRYTNRHVSYPDDLGYILAVGGVDVHLGVYNK
ncbi:hypothetical protein HOR61_gp60 [Escherichia phage vB_EcoS-IME253]|uniref:Uncharacterized protein n=2 Tax=Rtpvirus TaxID=1920864 RepID=A0A9E6YZT0_9CAUD|nr:hypothetical protein HOR61_gp60 [Escherichia phage vB_EcoS-IME253]APU93260.1 hypothetical protein [Escherichia phage vB_EcoS-IME253]UMO77954.1 hypothetical protein [Escherichia phage ZL19]WRH07483.1 hypothetical protein [Escherichia phage phiA2-1]